MPSLLDIVLHTPLWVWPLLALVLWLGWWGRQPRTVPPLRLAILPMVALGSAVAGIGIGWLAGLLLRERRWVRRSIVAGAALPPLALAAFAAVIAFDAPRPVPRLAAGDGMPGFQSWNLAEIPEVRRVAARDGAPLTSRLYPARADRAVVLVHGSSSASISMHKSAQALQAA